jgi:chromosome segregation ATPase
MAKADITIEIHDLRNEPSKIFTDAKLSAGVTRIIHEKNELQLKYDRLLKDYNLARHECKLRDEHIDKLKEEREKLLEENSVLRERLELLENDNRTLHEIINRIRMMTDCRSS